MRVVGAFAGDLLEREAAGEDGALRSAERGEEGLLLVGPVDVRGERLAVDENIDLLFVLLFDELHFGSDGGLAERGKEGEEGEGVFHGYLLGHTPAPKVANLKGATYPRNGVCVSGFRLSCV